MNFDLSEEQQLLQQTVKQFAEGECPPSRRRELFDGEDAFDPTLWKGLAELGVAGLPIAEEYGGAGLELLDLAVVSETLGEVALPAPLLGHALASLAIQLGGSDAQRERWLPALASGEALGSVAFCEAGGGWQPAQWQLAAGKTLSGVKLHAPGARHADLVVVGTAGGGLSVVERGASGLEIEDQDGADRTRRIDVVRLAATPCEALERGADAAPRVRDAGLVLLAADAFGGAAQLVSMSAEYARTREQFGVTIGHFQALKHQLADMAVEAEPGRALYWYAAHAFDHLPTESERVCALAKAHVTDRYLDVARAAVEAHGGIGFTWESDVQIWYKRAMFDRAWLGTPAVHRERCAALAGW